MNKQEKIQIILVTLVISFALNIFFGRYITAQISTLPVLNRLKILSPQAPIVINKKEEIRISDSGDVLTTAQAMESKVSALAYVEKGRLVLAGTVLNLTTDGIFVSTLGVLPKVEQVQYYIINSEENVVPVKEITKDTVSGLIFLKTNLNAVAVSALGSSASLKPGEKLVVLSTDTNLKNRVDSKFVSQAQNNFTEETFSSDKFSRSFELSNTNGLLSGQVLVNLKGEVVGLVNGESIVSSDVLRHIFTLYLKNSGQIAYPKFGFEYRVIGKPESKILNISEGLLVTLVNAKSQAGTSGLKANDIILQIDDNIFSKNIILPEEVFQKYANEKNAKLKVLRNKETIEINLKLAE